jgi:sec-independent protein translocase protein TatA
MPNSFMLGSGELVLILAILVILLGARKLPEVAKALGEGFSHFRDEMDSLAHDAGRSLGGIYGKPAAEALTPENQTAELYNPAALQEPNETGHGRMNGWIGRCIAFWRTVWRTVFKRVVPRE